MFKQIILLLLISTSFLQAAAQPCSDTLLPHTAGYAALCCEKISYTKDTIHIQAMISSARLVERFPCYRFILQSCDSVKTDPHPFPGSYILDDSLMHKLPRQLLMMNNKPFSGSLRIAVRFYNRLVVNGPFSGYHLHIFYFRHGLLLRRELVHDILLSDEHTQERPA